LKPASPMPWCTKLGAGGRLQALRQVHHPLVANGPVIPEGKDSQGGQTIPSDGHTQGFHAPRTDATIREFELSQRASACTMLDSLEYRQDPAASDGRSMQVKCLKLGQSIPGPRRLQASPTTPRQPDRCEVPNPKPDRQSTSCR
jgi:hypothetical protein